MPELKGEALAFWTELCRAADDDEANTLVDVAVRLGYLWRCECSWVNGSEDAACEACRRPKGDGDVCV